MKFQLLLIILSLFFILGVSDLLINNVENDGVEKCLQKIVRSSGFENVFIIYMNNQTILLKDLPKIIININTSMNVKVNLTWTEDIVTNYIFFLESYEDLKNLAPHLKYIKFWHPKYKHIIIFRNLVDNNLVCNYLWNIYIYNVVIIVANINRTWDLFTYFPYNQDICTKNVTETYIENCETIDQIKYYYPKKEIMYYSRCVFKAITIYRPPFVLSYNKTDDMHLNPGFECTIMNTVSERMNFTLKYINHGFNDWGTKDINDSFSNMFGLLQNNQANIMFGAMYFSYSYTPHFDYSIPYTFVKTIWVVPGPKQISLWKNLTVVFDYYLWMLYFGTYIIIAAFWWFATQRNMKLEYCLLQIWALLLVASVKINVPQKIKMQLISWSICFMIINTLYVSKLIVVLTKPIFEKPINSVSDIIYSGLKMGFHPGFQTTLNRSLPEHKYILNNYEKCSVGFECTNRTAFEGDFATIKNNIQTCYMIPRWYTSKTGRSLVHIFGETSEITLLG